MKNVSIVVHCDDEYFHHLKRYCLNVLSSGFKVRSISEDMSLDTLRKISMDVVGDYRILIYLFSVNLFT